MPCDTIQRSTVTMVLRADNKQHLLAALKSLNYRAVEIGETVTFSGGGQSGVFANGELKVTSRNPEAFDLNALKRAYSTEVVKSTAKKFGWQIKSTGENKFAVQKASF